MVQIGEKTIDYNEDFRLYLTTRHPNPEIPPDAGSVITEVNFTTTRAGLTGQVCHKMICTVLIQKLPQLTWWLSMWEGGGGRP